MFLGIEFQVKMSVLQCLHNILQATVHLLQATEALVHILQSYKFFPSQVLATAGYCIERHF